MPTYCNGGNKTPRGSAYRPCRSDETLGSGRSNEDRNHSVSLLLVVKVRREDSGCSLPPRGALFAEDFTDGHIEWGGAVLNRDRFRRCDQVVVPTGVRRLAAHGRDEGILTVMLNPHQCDLSDVAGFGPDHRHNDHRNTRLSERVAFGSAGSFVQVDLVANPSKGAGDIGSVDSHLARYLNRTRRIDVPLCMPIPKNPRNGFRSTLRRRVLLIAALVVGANTVTSTSPASAQVVCHATDGDAEGCYQYGDMFDFLGMSVGLVNQFMASNYKRPPNPSYTYIRENGVASSWCGAADDTSFHYCGADEGVYVGQRLLYYFYAQSGDAAAAVAVAHEAGHHLQNLAGIRPRTRLGRIRQENQADCVAGAFVAYLDEQGILNEEDDIADIETILPLIASSEGPNRDHGTLAERTRSISRGMAGGLSACNAYFPTNPLKA
jgi:Putative neutral zinc metallopeptidase